jgi:hypothetical protein
LPHKRLFIAAATAILFAYGASTSTAQHRTASVDRQLSDASRVDARAGIARAHLAGINIDPEAEALMAQAPAGTCLNDPTQPKCPVINEVIRAATVERPDGSLAYALAATPAERSSATVAADGAEAQAAALPQCFVRAGYPYYAAGSAWGDGAHQCTAAVSSQELFVSLERTTNGVWRLMDSRYASGPGGITIRRTARYDCGHANERHYRTTSTGYAILQGKLYTAMQRKDDYITCPNT